MHHFHLRCTCPPSPYNCKYNIKYCKYNFTGLMVHPAISSFTVKDPACVHLKNLKILDLVIKLL